MIPAVEALLLSCAQLTAEESAAVSDLMIAIDKHVHAEMRIGGVNFQTNETRNMVLAETDFRLKLAGYETVWQAVQETSKFTGRKQTIGHLLMLSASLDSFAAARKIQSTLGNGSVLPA